MTSQQLPDPTPDPGNGVEVWVKWEGANPTGSMKDRMALSMVQGAIARDTVATWMERLTQAGIPCSPVNHVDQLVAVGGLDDDRLVVGVARHLGEPVPDDGGVAGDPAVVGAGEQRLVGRWRHPDSFALTGSGW